MDSESANAPGPWMALPVECSMRRNSNETKAVWFDRAITAGALETKAWSIGLAPSSSNVQLHVQSKPIIFTVQQCITTLIAQP